MYGMAGFTTWHKEHVREYLLFFEEEVRASLLLSSSSTTPKNERIRLRMKPNVFTPVFSAVVLFILVLVIYARPF